MQIASYSVQRSTQRITPGQVRILIGHFLTHAQSGTKRRHSRVVVIGPQISRKRVSPLIYLPLLDGETALKFRKMLTAPGTETRPICRNLIGDIEVIFCEHIIVINKDEYIAAGFGDATQTGMR